MKSLIVHHIISRRSGGRDNVENLMVLCRKCHNRLHAEMAIGGGVE
jgi:5-methylcytosine-specific restriction endonuclease McrA